jgi:phosphoglycolate phosphatase
MVGAFSAMKEVIFGRRPFDTELIIFDKDGTLTDFRKTWFPILEKRLQILTRRLELQKREREFRNLTYRRFGIDGERVDPYGPFPYTPPHEDEVIFATILYELGVPYEKGKMAARESVSAAESEIDRIAISMLYEGVHEVLQQLHRGGLLLALATADLTEIAVETLRRLGIYGLFDFVVGADMVSHNKPHPEMIEKTLEALHIDREMTCMVGDSIVDTEMGRRAGVGLVVGVTESGIAASGDLSRHADTVISSVRDIRLL